MKRIGVFLLLVFVGSVVCMIVCTSQSDSTEEGRFL